MKWKIIFVNIRRAIGRAQQKTIPTSNRWQHVPHRHNFSAATYTPFVTHSTHTTLLCYKGSQPTLIPFNINPTLFSRHSHYLPKKPSAQPPKMKANEKQSHSTKRQGFDPPPPKPPLIFLHYPTFKSAAVSLHWPSRAKSHLLKCCHYNIVLCSGANFTVTPTNPPPLVTTEITKLRQAIVIDVGFISDHSMQSVNHDFLRALNWSNNHSITWIAGVRYLLVLPPNITRDAFMTERFLYLENFGYVWFPWSLRVAAPSMNLHFKVWLDILNLPPYSWSLE